MKNVNAIDSIIDELVSLGSGNIDIMKFNKKWTFKIVNTEEHIAILDSSAAADNSNDMMLRIFKMQQETMKQALVSIDDQIVSDDDKNKLFNQVNPYITQTLYRLYDAERAKKENEIENIK